MLHAAVEYNTDLFEAETIGRMLGHYQTLLEGIVANPEQRLSDLPLLTSAERQQIVVDWNRTEVTYPRDRCLHELIEEQVERAPDAVAVVFDDKQLTYRQLNERADQLARYLQGLGVGPDMLVALFLERSLDMVVGMLGVLKAGGAYVPIDPTHPSKRLAFMLADAQPLVLLTQERLQSKLPPHRSHVVVIDAGGPPAARLKRASAPDRACSPGDLAYVIYTSGSTGEPKGVEINHSAVVNMLASMQRRPGLSAEDTMLAITTLTFDIAALEIFLPLVCGACVVIAGSETIRDGVALINLIERSGASVLQATPATLRMLLDAGWAGAPRLKVLCGGEAWTAELASLLLPRCDSLWNMYGPTETTVWSAVAKVKAGRAIVIGSPIANTQIHILDRHLQPTPIGVPGELHIGGIGLARGYHNRLELTAEKFIPDPFRSEPGARLYKTGDLARYLPNGAIEYLGRMDHQVKIRGFRIELGEIKSALAGLPGVREAVVVAREDVPGDKRLVAYFTSAEDISAAALRVHLASVLPEYMAPAAYVRLDALPLTPNGKLDRRALPAPEDQAFGTRAYEAPEGPLETAIAAIWAELLHLERVGRHDNFFDLGGHSLLAIRLIGRIRATTGVEIALTSIFKASTVAGMAEIVGGQRSVPSFSPLVLLRPGASGPPVFIVHGVGGSAVELIPIAKSISVDHPVYGIQAKGFDGTGAPHDRVEAMAEYYVDAIAEAQPEGPYLLAGLCFGGLVAMEIARGLSERGERVGLLALLETYPNPRNWPLPVYPERY